MSITSGDASVVGSGTSWVQNAWPGCLIEFDGSGVYYKIAEVNSDTGIVLTDILSGLTLTDVSYSIYKTHQHDHANYKLNLQPFTTGMIYSCPTITMPVDAKKICGPFYASVVETQTDEVFDEMIDDDVLIDSQLTVSGSSMDHNIATDGTNWMCIAGLVDGDQVICKSTSPYTDWESTTLPTDFTLSGFIVSYNSKFYVSGKNSSNQPGYAVTENVGSSWTVHVNTSLSNLLATSVAAAPSGRVIISIASQTATNNIGYYTDNDGETWSIATTYDVNHYGRPQFIYYSNSYFICSLRVGGLSQVQYSSIGASFSPMRVVVVNSGKSSKGS